MFVTHRTSILLGIYLEVFSFPLFWWTEIDPGFFPFRAIWTSDGASLIGFSNRPVVHNIGRCCRLEHFHGDQVPVDGISCHVRRWGVGKISPPNEQAHSSRSVNLQGIYARQAIEPRAEFLIPLGIIKMQNMRGERKRRESSGQAMSIQ
ncbi:hypothetical protein BS47DRAFT_253034 [Hydnum rufescens UP504]|uniref:Uncharacterized protein n=1 Tax=Hydnum rufescens UP504 TaxID=1448309 RepID=A0A9P6DNL2_9AGAM|nr:hypothetical protein BS47DRAFT_253034 [Hydnum rufescens UP504]